MTSGEAGSGIRERESRIGGRRARSGCRSRRAASGTGRALRAGARVQTSARWTSASASTSSRGPRGSQAGGRRAAPNQTSRSRLRRRRRGARVHETRSGSRPSRWATRTPSAECRECAHCRRADRRIPRSSLRVRPSAIDAPSGRDRFRRPKSPLEQKDSADRVLLEEYRNKIQTNIKACSLN